MSTDKVSRTVSNQGRSVTALTITHDVPNNCIATKVEIALTPGKTVSTVTVGGSSATAAATRTLGGARYEVWILANPPVGLQKAIVITPSASCDIVASASSYVGNDQSHIFITGTSAPK